MANPLKLSPQWIENQILSEEYLIRGGRFMVCIIYTKGGYYVTGESAPINPAEFTEELGKKYSREEAVAKIWRIEGIIARKQHYGVECDNIEGANTHSYSLWSQVPEGFDFLISTHSYGEEHQIPMPHKYEEELDRFVDTNKRNWPGNLVRNDTSFTVLVRPGKELPTSTEN